MQYGTVKKRNLNADCFAVMLMFRSSQDRRCYKPLVLQAKICSPNRVSIVKKQIVKNKLFLPLELVIKAK